MTYQQEQRPADVSGLSATELTALAAQRIAAGEREGEPGEATAVYASAIALLALAGARREEQRGEERERADRECRTCRGRLSHSVPCAGAPRCFLPAPHTHPEHCPNPVHGR